ncbi:phosphoglycolate phosphatase-like HAD superfamily hydrolase [Streptomyces atratus]
MTTYVPTSKQPHVRRSRKSATFDRMERIGVSGAALIDIDGVLTVDWQPLPGTVAAMERLRAAGLPLALVTNTTSRTRARIAAKLAGAGFPSARTTSSPHRRSPPRICASTTPAPGARCSTAATSAKTWRA